MVALSSNPFLRVFFFFALGILFGNAFSIASGYTWIGFGSVIIFYGLQVICMPVKKYNWSGFWLGNIGLLGVFFAGMLRVGDLGSVHDNVIIQELAQVEFYHAVVTHPGVYKQNVYEAEVEILQVKIGAVWVPCSYKVILWQPLKQGQVKECQYGDRILIKGNPSPIKSGNNPFGFDYQSYQAEKGVYFNHFVQADHLLFYGNEPKLPLKGWVFQLRRYCENIITTNVEGKHEAGVVLAMVMGSRENLGKEIKSAYAATGAMHVMAVSGLHVGVIFCIILILLKPLERSPKTRFSAQILAILGLWGFTFFAGAPTSALRAVTMFSVLIIGKLISQQSFSYNTLAVAGFILLWFDPLAIVSPGFQFSFLAVLGIFYFTPKVYQLFSFKHVVLDKAWEISSMSIGAQIMVLPISIYYFNQIPFYFLLSNLIVVPAAGLILSLGLLLLCFSFFEPIAYILGKGLSVLVGTVNFIVVWLKDLPLSHVTNVHFSGTQVVLLYMAILTLLAFFYFREKMFYFLFSGIIVIFSIERTMLWYSSLNQYKLIVYNAGRNSVVHVIKGRDNYLLADSVFVGSSYKEYLIDPVKTRLQLHEPLVLSANSAMEGKDNWLKVLPFGQLMVVNGKSILRIDQPIKEKLVNGLEVDYVVLGKNAIRNINEEMGNIGYNHLIIDSSYLNGIKTSLVIALTNSGKVVSAVSDNGGQMFDLK
jgi:competence protein ComEC